jgi:TonB family protein
MINKLKKLAFLIMYVSITYTSFSQNTDSTKQESTFSIVEISATFMGGGIEVFRAWVQRNLVYPPIAAAKGICGKVMVKFTIDENGKLYNAEIYQGVDTLLDNEVLRVVSSSPMWEPARLKGQRVKQSFVIPIVFLLGKNKKHNK